MVIAKVTVTGTSIQTDWCKKIPQGIIGAKVQIKYADECWGLLNKTVVFRSSVTKDVLNAGDEVLVPLEVVKNAGATLFMGIYGTNADSTIAVPTFWTSLGKIQGATDPSGDPSTDPSLPVWAQMERRFEKLMYLADNPQEAIAPPDWNATESEPGHIQNRTHWVEVSDDAVCFDGNLAGKESVFMEDDTYMVKISDAILTKEDLIGSTVTVCMPGEDPEEMTIEVTDENIYDMASEGIPALTINGAVVCLHEDVAAAGISATAGVYFACVVIEGSPVAYVKHLSCLPGGTEIVHKLDNKFLNLDWLPRYTYGTEIVLDVAKQLFNDKNCQQDFNFSLKSLTHYSVTWDGVSYSCYSNTKADMWFSLIGIGNLSLIDAEYENTGEPFCIVSRLILGILLRTEIYSADEVAEHTVGISIVDRIAERLPAEFLPKEYTMPTDIGYNKIVNVEIRNAYAAFQNGGTVYAQYKNSLFRILSIYCDLIDSMFDHICMTDGSKIMIWHRNQGWTEFSQKGFILASSNYNESNGSVLQGKKYRFTVDESGTLNTEDVTGTM